MDERPFPRGVAWLIRMYLVTIGLAVVASGLTLMGMRYAQWNGSSRLPYGVYHWMLTVHGWAPVWAAVVPAGLLALGHIVVAAAFRPERTTILWAAFAGFGSWVVAVGLLALPAPSASAAFAGGSCVLTLIYFLAALDLARLRGTALLAVVGAVGAPAWQCFALAWFAVKNGSLGVAAAINGGLVAIASVRRGETWVSRQAQLTEPFA